MVEIGRQLQLPEAELDRIQVAALLHDVGKVAIPEEILEKPSALSTGEWRSVVQHPRIGQVILEQAAALKDAVPIILHHHERFAGHGYPYGLRGNEIPLGARIVAIADAYDAMIHDRPYKRAMTHDQAIAELRRHSGTQFDPDLVNLFCDLYAAHAPEPDPTVLAMVRREADAHTDGLVLPDMGARVGHTRRAPRPKTVAPMTATTSDGTSTAMAGEGAASVELRPVPDPPTRAPRLVRSAPTRCDRRLTVSGPPAATPRVSRSGASRGPAVALEQAPSVRRRVEPGHAHRAKGGAPAARAWSA